MSVLLGLLLMAASGDGFVPSAGSPPDQISVIPPAANAHSSFTFVVRLVEMKGLEWRGALHDRLDVVTHQDAATVWVAAHDAIADICKRAERVIGPGRVATPGEVSVSWVSADRFVETIKKCSNTPEEHARQPQGGRFRESVRFHVSGRKLDQGVLARVSLDDKGFPASHTVTFTDRASKQSARDDVARVTYTYQVPELVSGKVEGEWLIPNDGALVVSLGPHTFADNDGKAVVRERLAVIEADHGVSPPVPQTPGAAEPPAPLGFGLAPLPVPAVQRFVIRLTPAELLQGVHRTLTVMPPVPGSITALPPAVPPSHSLPVAVPPIAPAALPPLPDDRLRPAQLQASAEPHPSPQANLVDVLTKVDSAIQHANAEVDAQGDPCRGAKTTTGWTTLKESTLRIPLGSHLAVEIRAKVTPSVRPSEEPAR